MKYLYGIVILMLSVILSSCTNKELGCNDGVCYIENNYYEVEFQLKGSEFVQVPLNGNYVENGVIFLLDDEDLSNEVTTKSTLDASVSGIYEIEYQILVNNTVFNKIRTVEVLKDEKISFYLLGTSEISIEFADIYEEPGYVAVNNVTNENLFIDVTVTGSVDSKKAGSYKITYTLSHFDVLIVLDRVVIVKEFAQFDFRLSGYEEYAIFLGEEYEERGVAFAYDYLDRINYKDKVNISGSVNPNIPGDYVVTYSVTVQGILYELVRKVRVLEDRIDFRLYGDEIMNINLGEEFTDPGGAIYINDELFYDNILSYYDIVDTNTPGTYIVSYRATMVIYDDDGTIVLYEYDSERTVIVT